MTISTESSGKLAVAIIVGLVGAAVIITLLMSGIAVHPIIHPAPAETPTPPVTTTANPLNFNYQATADYGLGGY